MGIGDWGLGVGGLGGGGWGGGGGASAPHRHGQNTGK